MRTGSTSLGRHPRRGTRRLWPWLVGHPIELALGTLLVGAFIGLLRTTRGSYFQGDDWKLIIHGGSIRGMFDPYNDHLSLTISAIYRTVVEVFGFSYTAFRVVGLVSLLAVPLVFFIANRAVLGAPLASIASISMLGFANMELYPSVLNHYLVLIGGIGCAALLNRGRGADWALGLMLLLALTSAGGGLAVAAACVAHNACTRPHLRRWLVVLGPCALWVCWWLLAGSGTQSQFRPTNRPTISEALDYAWSIAWSPFDHLGGGNTVIAIILASGFGAYGVSRARAGRGEAANFLAWTVALGTWSVGLAYGRGARIVTEGASTAAGGLLQESAGNWTGFRYEFLALGFAFLALIPRQPIRWPSRFQTSNPRTLAVATVAILAFGVGQAIAVHNEVGDTGRLLADNARTTKAELIVLDLGPRAVPDEVIMVGRFFGLEAGELRSLLDRHGYPPSSTADTADQQLLSLGIARADRVARRELDCQPVTAPISWLPTSIRPLYLWSDQPTWTVEVRRFGEDWITVAQADATQAVALTLPALFSETPWQVRANGACRRAS